MKVSITGRLWRDEELRKIRAGKDKCEVHSTGLKKMIGVVKDGD